MTILPVFTAEFWIKASSRIVIISRDYPASMKADWSVVYDSSRQRLEFMTQINQQPDAYFWSSDSSLPKDTWNHVAVVVNGPSGNLKIYINGFLNRSGTFSSRTFDAVTGLALGGYYNNPSGANSNGYIDEVRYWNYERTEQQIQSAKDSKLPLNDRRGLMGYWMFCGNFADSSGGKNDMTPRGSPQISDLPDLIGSLSCGIQLYPPIPFIIALGPTVFCEGDSVVLDAGSGYRSYLWSSGETTRFITTKVSGQFTVTVTDSNGLAGTSSPIFIVVKSRPGAPVICRSGDTLISSLADSYQWYKNDIQISGATNRIYISSQSGSYTVSVTNADGCPVSSQPVIFQSMQVDTISGIINIYTKVSSIEVTCDRNKVNVSSSAGFTAGDRVLIIQMKGAEIDLTNSANFGTILNYNSAGNYEFGTIESVTGNSIILRNTLLRQYDPAGFVQLVRVPKYRNVLIAFTLTSKAWDGNTGGIVVFEASDSVIFRSNIDVSGKGFKGGSVSINVPMYTVYDYYYTFASQKGGEKGEGITASQTNFQAGRGPLANGGGGGNAVNTGGGGGGNIAQGGQGGKQYIGSGPDEVMGLGGKNLIYSNTDNKVFLGGGGGGGHQNDGTGTSGANGGGIVILRCGTIAGNNFSILANGFDAITGGNDGAGGGGAGGSVLIDAQIITSAISNEMNGGKGGDVTNTFTPGHCHGPGGGGGAGIIWMSSASLSPKSTVSFNGGLPGIALNSNAPCYNTSWGATAGSNGASLFDLIIPENTKSSTGVAVKTGPDHIICPDSCVILNANSIGGTPPYSFSWSPPIGLNNPIDSMPRACPKITTTYTVTITDKNGCQATGNISVTIHPPAAAPIISQNGDTLFSTTAKSYQWYRDGILIIGATNRWYIPTQIGSYSVRITDDNGCPAMSGIYLYSRLTVITSPTQAICADSCVVLSAHASGGNPPYTYRWSPPTGLNNPDDSIPVACPKSTLTYMVTVQDKDSTRSIGTVSVIVYQKPPLPAITLNGDTLISTPAKSYQWYRDGVLIFGATNQSYVPTQTGSYSVRITDDNGCPAISNAFIFSNLKITVGPTQTICADSCVVLNAHASGGNPPYTYRWSPQIGLNNPDDSIPVACPKSNTTYMVTVQDKDSTRSIGTVSIIVYQKPPLPVITKRGDTLFATPAKNYQWYKDGVLIFGATNQWYIPMQSGSYSVRIIDINGCNAKSDVFLVEKGTVESSLTLTCADSIFYSPGEIISVPIALTSSKDLVLSGIRNFTAWIRFNKNVLQPIQDSGISFIDTGKERVVTIRQQRESTMNQGILFEIKCIVMLGDTICTQIHFDSLVWTDGMVNTTIQNQDCKICVKTCHEGGTRLFSSEGKFTLKQNRPNPFNAATMIEYEINEDGFTQLYIVDVLGRIVATLVNGQRVRGTYSVSYDASSLTSGLYFYILKSPTQMIYRRMELIK